MAPERRKHPRVSIAADIDVGSADNFFAGRTRDISVGGLFVETDSGLAIGSAVAVRLKLEGAVFDAEGEVTWALDDEHGRVVGVGIRFVTLGIEARRAIGAFMKKRAPMLLDMELPSDEPPPARPDQKVR